MGYPLVDLSDLALRQGGSARVLGFEALVPDPLLDHRERRRVFVDEAPHKGLNERGDADPILRASKLKRLAQRALDAEPQLRVVRRPISVGGDPQESLESRQLCASVSVEAAFPVQVIVTPGGRYGCMGCTHGLIPW